jgi:hypothetical protein
LPVEKDLAGFENLPDLFIPLKLSEDHRFTSRRISSICVEMVRESFIFLGFK